jgi:ABC-type lipoprotein release transport system permease subunit
MKAGEYMAIATDIRIAFRNLGRNPKRTALGLGAIVIAQVAVLWFTGFMNGYQKVVFTAVTGPMLGQVQIHAKDYRKKREIWNGIDHVAQLMAGIQKIPGVRQATARSYAPVLAALHETGETALVTGLELEKEIQPQGLLEKLKPNDLPENGEVLIGANLAQELGVKPGDTLALVGQSADGAPASGLFKVKSTVNTAADSVNRKGILMSLAAVQNFLGMPDQAHEIVLRARDSARLEELVQKLRQDPDLKTYEILTWSELQPQLASLLGTFEKMNSLVLVLIFITTAAGIANTMLMAAFERTHEFGVLMSIGCRPRRLIGTLVYEALALGLSGVVLGTLVGFTWISYQGVHGITFGNLKDFAIEGVQLNIIFPYLQPVDVVRSVLCVAITSLLASWWPAERIAKMDPLEAMRS